MSALRTTRQRFGSRRAAACCAALVLTGASVEAQTIQRQQPRPPPLEARAHCELFRGSGTGNDPTYEVEVQLCVDDQAVTGSFQSSSLHSGWSRRELAGTLSADGRAFELRDARWLEQRPAPGWDFCLVDRYELRRDGAQLRGSYHAESCDDGELTLERVDGGGEARPPTEQDEDEDDGSSFGCATSPGTTPPPRMLLGLGLALASRLRRRVARRGPAGSCRESRRRVTRRARSLGPSRRRTGTRSRSPR